jgi:hypothetical protein
VNCADPKGDYNARWHSRGLKKSKSVVVLETQIDLRKMQGGVWCEIKHKVCAEIRCVCVTLPA